jgi:hypothetical protein
MANIRLLRSQIMQQLNADVPNNLERYRSGDFSFLIADPSNYIEIEQEFDGTKLMQIDCDLDEHKEVESCVNIHQSMGNITPYLARDPRLWVYLTHTALLGYARKRWPIPADNEKALAHIRMHFFASGNRGIERDNAASRLWWMATLCSRVKGMSLAEALTVFLYQYDVRANIVERPTTSQSIPVFAALVNKLNESYQGDKGLFDREKFRAVMKELNLQGGVKLISVLAEDEIGHIVDECAN